MKPVINVLCCTVLLLWQNPNSKPTHRPLLSKEKAIELSKDELVKRGYRVDNMQLLTFPSPWTSDSLAHRFGKMLDHYIPRSVQPRFQHKSFWRIVWKLKNAFGGIVDVFLDVNSSEIIYAHEIPPDPSP